MIEEAATMSDAPVTETTAPTSAESSKGESVEAGMEKVFDRLNPGGETDGRTPPEAAQYSKSPEVETGDTEIGPEQSPQATDIPMPTHKRAQELWAMMPEEVREFVLKREAEVQDGMSALGQEAKAGRDIAALFDEHREFVPSGMDHANAVRHLLAADKMIRQDPVNAILHLAANHGVDLHQRLGAPPVPEGYLAAAEVEQRAQALAEQHIQQYIQQYQQQQEWHQQQYQAAEHQRREQYLTAEIERFAKDASRADHWAEAEDDIYKEVLALQAQVAAGIEPARSEMDLLKLAYERATSRNPAIFVKTAKGREKAAQERKKADEARRLASLNAKSKMGTAPAAAPKDMESLMTEVYERLHGRSY